MAGEKTHFLSSVFVTRLSILGAPKNVIERFLAARGSCMHWLIEFEPEIEVLCKPFVVVGSFT